MARQTDPSSWSANSDNVSARELEGLWDGTAFSGQQKRLTPRPVSPVTCTPDPSEDTFVSVTTNCRELQLSMKTGKRSELSSEPERTS